MGLLFVFPDWLITDITADNPSYRFYHSMEFSAESHSRPHPTLVLPEHPDMNAHGRDAEYRELSVLQSLLRHDDLALMEKWWPVLDRPDQQHLLPAHTAIEMGAVKCFSHIVENYPSWLDRRDFSDFPAFVYAVRGGPMFFELLLDRTDLSTVYGEERLTALHVLFRGCNNSMMGKLLPLHAPVTAATLIDKGCDVNAGDMYHRRAINDLVGVIMELSPGTRGVEFLFLTRYVRERVPSVNEHRIGIKSSLQVLLEKGALPDCYKTAMPSMEVVATTLYMYDRDIGNLDINELTATVESLCDISDMLLSHGACRHPCADFLTKQLDPAASEGIQPFGMNPNHRESILIEYFVELQPLVQLFLNALPHIEYYDAVEKLSKSAGEKTKAISNMEQGEIVERSTRSAVALSGFVRLREKHVRPLKHITRLYIAGFFGGYADVADLAGVAQLPLPEFLRGYILRYKN